MNDNAPAAFDESALAAVRAHTRTDKLSRAERIAIYAFYLKGVPPKLLAKSFKVHINAIYYIGSVERSAAHKAAKAAFEQMGEARVWAEIVTPAQIESINEGMHALLRRKPQDGRRRSKPRIRAKSERTGAIAAPVEAARNEAVGLDSPF